MMKKTIFKKNTPIDEKRIDLIERMISRLIRRSHKTVTCIIPSQVFSSSNSGDINCELIRLMLMKGKIEKVRVVLNKRPKTPVAIEARMLNGDVGTSKTFYIDRTISVNEVNVDTVDGTMLTAIARCDDPEVTEIWLAITWTPWISSGRIEKAMIESLEESYELSD